MVTQRQCMPRPHKIDRRVAYQQRHIDLGLCVYCPAKATHGIMCKKHRQKHRKRVRDDNRTRAGLPLDGRLKKTKTRKY